MKADRCAICGGTKLILNRLERKMYLLRLSWRLRVRFLRKVFRFNGGLADLVEALCWFFECHDAYYWQRREASRVGLYELELLYGEAKNELRNALTALKVSND